MNSACKSAFESWPAALTIMIGMSAVGCGPTALGPGSVMPELQVAGWTNGAAPDLDGRVVVLEIFATW